MLKLDHIKKTFNPGTVNEKAAIRDLSLHLEPGDFATVIGSNGAGKSTMFAAIAGSFITDSGSITLNGKTCPWRICGRPEEAFPSAGSQKRIRNFSESSFPCWTWGWRTG